MKKKLQIFVFLGMIFQCTSTFAQTRELGVENSKNLTTTAKTHLAVLINVVNTNLYSGKSNSALTNDKKSIRGLQFGLACQTDYTPKFSLVSELYFIMKGGEFESSISSGGKKSKLRLYTLELPLLARFYIGNVYLNAGPSVSYNVYGTRKVDGNSSSISFKSSSEGFRRWDAGVQIGAGYMFQVKQKMVGLDIRYSNGLTNIAYGSEIRNRYVNIGIHLSKARKSNLFGKFVN